MPNSSYSCLPIDHVMFYYPFRHYFKHATLVENCFPLEKDAEPKPLSNGLSYLTYYTRSKPVKLAKVGKYLYKRLLSDIRSRKYNDVLVELQIFDALLDSNSRDIGFFGTYVIHSILEAAQTKRVDLLWYSAQTLCSFCKYHVGSTVVIDQEMRSSYSQAIEIFSSFLTMNFSDEKTLLTYHAMSLKVLYYVAVCQDTYIGDGLTELNKIISSLLKKMWVLFSVGALPSIVPNPNLDNSLEPTSSPILFFGKPKDSNNSLNARLASKEGKSDNSDHEKKFNSSNKGSDPFSITLSDSEESAVEVFSLSLSDTKSDDVDISNSIRRGVWYVLSSIVESSYRSNLRLIVISFFKFMESFSESWDQPQFPCDIFDFITSIISPQYRSVIISEILIYLDKTVSQDPGHQNHSSTSSCLISSNLRNKIQLSVVYILERLVNGPVVLVGVSILEVLSKLVSTLIEVSKNDDCSNVDLNFSLESVSEPSAKSSDLNSAQEASLLVNKLLETLLLTIGGLTKNQNYENQDSDVINYISNLIDTHSLLSPPLSHDYPNVTNYTSSIDGLVSSELYSKSIWLLKAIRSVVSNLLKASLERSASNSIRPSYNPPKNGINWTSFKPVVQIMLTSIDPRIRILSGQILVLTLEYNTSLQVNSIKNNVSSPRAANILSFSQTEKSTFPNVQPSYSGTIHDENDLKLRLESFSSQFSSFDPTSNSQDISISKQANFQSNTGDEEAGLDRNIISIQRKSTLKSQFDMATLEKNNLKLLNQFSSSPFHNDHSVSADGRNNLFSSNMGGDSSVSYVLHAMFKLLVNSLVTPNSVCDFLIANSFLSVYTNTSPITQDPTPLQIINGIYQNIVPCYGLAVDLAKSLDFSAPNSIKTNSVNGLESSSKQYLSHDSKIDSSIADLKEVHSFLDHFCFVQTIYGHILNQISSQTSTTVNSQSESSENPTKSLSNYVDQVTANQKINDCWKSQVELDLFNPVVNWLTDNHPFVIPNKDVSFWDFSQITDFLASGESDKDVNIKRDISADGLKSLNEFLRDLSLLYPHLQNSFKSIGSSPANSSGKVRSGAQKTSPSGLGKFEIDFGGEIDSINLYDVGDKLVTDDDLNRSLHKKDQNSGGLPAIQVNSDPNADMVVIASNNMFSLVENKSTGSLSINDTEAVVTDLSTEVIPDPLGSPQVSAPTRNFKDEGHSTFRHELELGLIEFEIVPESNSRTRSNNKLDLKTPISNSDLTSRDQGPEPNIKPSINANDLKYALADGFNLMNNLLEMNFTLPSRSGKRSIGGTSPNVHGNNQDSYNSDSGSEYSLDLTVDPEYTDRITNEAETKMVFDYLKI
ncbi:Protein efr3 [Smittium mucronatum]|uniref:Protein efr3 n=1 Tax=Smittium mucronatum TaxID=133383 RepID=A0A1R0H0D8_9FUNG|nr:Protein efr3 [Smittium mucronatum]